MWHLFCFSKQNFFETIHIASGIWKYFNIWMIPFNDSSDIKPTDKSVVVKEGVSWNERRSQSVRAPRNCDRNQFKRWLSFNKNSVSSGCFLVSVRVVGTRSGRPCNITKVLRKHYKDITKILQKLKILKRDTKIWRLSNITLMRIGCSV